MLLDIIILIMNKNICPLCLSNDTSFYSKDKKREYYICNRCKTIHVPSQFHLSTADEKIRYDKHTNSNQDKYYIEFLKRIVTPITSNVKPGSIGLDFGCGPGPILKDLFLVHNIGIEEYDLYYKDDKSLLNRDWNFIVTTEVIEHLSKPGNIIESLWNLIDVKGVLAIMSNLYTKSTDFPSWYYKGDPTHICFFCKESFLWLADKLDANVEFFDKDITILKKR